MQQQMVDPKGPNQGPPDQPSGDGSERERRTAQEIQRQLDEALADSFPASDPVSIVTSQSEEDWAENQDEKDSRDR